MTVEIKQVLEQDLFEAAVEYAKDAGSLIRDRLGNMGKIEQKKNNSDLVTEVDRLSEELIRRNIQENYPDHWILSEEDCGQENSYDAFMKYTSGYCWIIDPVDGTTNFIHGIPHFSVSIGIVKDGEPVIGVVFNPVTAELFTARKSLGAYRNGHPIKVGEESTLSEAVIATGFQANDFKAGSRVIQQMDNLAGKTRNIRMFGAASVDLCLVASGKISGFWHEGLNPWDTAAAVLILKEAGGKVTDKDGNPFRLFHDSLIASNGKIHEHFQKVIDL
jgi:myo-inositol-1(or 4)-monophosphatase